MSSKNKSMKRNKREEAQAKRIIKIVFIALIVLGFFLMLGFSFFG